MWRASVKLQLQNHRAIVGKRSRKEFYSSSMINNRENIGEKTYHKMKHTVSLSLFAHIFDLRINISTK